MLRSEADRQESPSRRLTGRTDSFALYNDTYHAASTRSYMVAVSMPTMIRSSLLSLLLASPGTSKGHATNVQVPASLATRALVPDVYGYSVEPVWLNYFVNSSLMTTLLQGITDITGKAPPIRIGGTTSDETYFIESLPDNATSVETAKPETWNVTASWYSTFTDYFPNGTEFVYCLNFADNSSDWANAQEQARAAWEALGEELVLFELGNEVDVSSLMT